MKHYPECPQHRPEGMDPRIIITERCICVRLHGLEERLLEKMYDDAAHHYREGFSKGLDKAIEAVLSCQGGAPSHEKIRINLPDAVNAIAALDFK